MPIYNACQELLDHNLVASRSDKTAFIDDNGTYNYGELDRRVRAFASALTRRGVAPGQRILLCIHDCIDFPVVFLGAIRAGVIPVPLNTLLTAGDYEYLIEDSRAIVAVVSSSLLPLFQPLLGSGGSLTTVLISGGGAPGFLSVADFCASGTEPSPVAATTSDDTCFWLYSSGSTGRPKGTVHRHASLMQTAELYARPIIGIDHVDITFSAAKLFFAYGLGNSLTFPLSAGATSVLMAERPTPAAVFKRLKDHSVTIFYGVPTLYAAMLNSPDLPSAGTLAIRRCTSAGEPLPESIGTRWSGAMGVDILDGIGSTEMLHIFLSNSPKDVRYGTTGKPVPGYALRIVDEAGQEVAPGELGELHVAGPSSASMYWNNRERTKSTFLGKWTRTGDKYTRTADGYYRYAGRTDDMLKVGGIYVSPAEVEAALTTHPDVLEVAVIGRKDGDELVKPAAFVVLKNDATPSDQLAQALKMHVKSRLAPYKYPRWIEFVSELPKTATGKIQRYRLRAAPEPH